MTNSAAPKSLRSLVPVQFWGISAQKPIAIFRQDLRIDQFPKNPDRLIRQIDYQLEEPVSDGEGTNIALIIEICIETLSRFDEIIQERQL